MRTIYKLGALSIQIAPFNVHEVFESGTADFAVKDIVGAEPPLEFVGSGGSEITLSGRLFPQEFGGLDELGLLAQMRDSGLPQYLMRGDGTPFGWWAILNSQTRSSYLDGNGVGKVIEVTIALRRARTPAATSFFSLMQGLINGN